MNIWQPEHPHHAVWREYTQSLLDGKPKVVEYRHDNALIWQTNTRPSWLIEDQYRIARPMLNVSYTVPMPVKVELDKGRDYWLAGGDKPLSCPWCDDSNDNRWLREGRIYLIREDAQAAIDARNAAYGEALK